MTVTYDRRASWVRPNLTNCDLCQLLRRRLAYPTYLLLLHQLRVGAVVDNILAKDRGGERAVDLLGIDILDLAVEDEVVALCVQTDSHLATQEDKGEDIAILLPISACLLPPGTRHTFFC